MSDKETHKAIIDAQAADWLVRVNASDVRDEDIMALTAWFEASPDHVEAYHRAEMLWASLDAETQEHPLSDAPAIVRLDERRETKIKGDRAKAKILADWRPWAALAGLAASLVLIFSSGVFSTQAASLVYQTAKGETRQVALSDGTQLHLNSDTRLTVALNEKARHIELDHGEVILNVIHDESRPLTLRAGDARITDIGTEFNVLRHAGTVSVTVKEGKVGVGPATAESPTHIVSAGEQSIHVEDSDQYSLAKADPDTAFAWEKGRAIYRDRPLSEVVSDLNRYFEKPLVVDDETGQLRLTAIITLDSEASVVKRLEAFLPVEATTTAENIRLRQRP